jgi:ATP-binding cassette, subfamily B, bacterial PglK
MDLFKYIQEVLYLLKNDRKKLPFIIGLFLFSSALDLIGLSLIAPYIALVLDLEGFKSSEIFSLLISVGISANPTKMLVELGFLLILIFLIKAVLGVLVNKKILNFCYNQGFKMRAFLMHSYQKMPYIEHLSRNSSESIYSIASLAPQYAHGTLQAMLRMISEGFVILFIFIFLAWQDPVILGVVIFFLGLIMFFYDVLFRHKLTKYGESANLSSTEMLKGVSEGMAGLKEIRILGKSDFFYNKVERGANGFYQATVKSSVITSINRYFLEFSTVLFVVLMVFKGVYFEKDLNDTIPILAVFGVAFIRLSPSINQVMNGISQMRYFRNSVKILYSDMQRVKEYEDDVSVMETSISVDQFQDIIFNNVSFSYLDQLKPTLAKISITVKRNDVIGIVGKSGSGKTTLIDMMLGLLSPSKGEIIYNGKKLHTRIQEWRSNIAYIPQKIFLIDDTLLQNITLGGDIDNSFLDYVLKASSLSELIEQLPQGVETIIGENGDRLSGGQRQRIALARALYHKRDIIIMDEATSALDDETEREIVNEIGQLKVDKTIIIISHKISTLKHCNKIFVLDKGEVLEETTYANLLLNQHFKKIGIY